MIKKKIYNWVIDVLPDWVKYYCAIQVGAHATTGKYGDTEVPKVTFMTVMERWRKDKDMKVEL